MTSTTNLTDEYIAAAARAGLTVPEDRLDGIVRLYSELRSMSSLLRSMNLTAADEPANIYTFDPILRSE
ncbi:hypothetical protein ATO6_18850 [Oceanicola sp. 22II-s10i]|uniref:hypothetical protein n=1 Tax=Oceanicola sp. 22II-s10i TaxID=1317116 RepID=UPI000B52633F|nr:hypothetical protein [Oceanicola sp. 22II-s10i]OWU83488.1 hypothetical protein ATO6_18850 [Oceanicola sp. 22II-s10i]